MTEIEELKDLYPKLSPEELLVAKENLNRYLSLAWEIMEDEHMSKPKTHSFPEDSSRGTMQGKVDSQTN